MDTLDEKIIDILERKGYLKTSVLSSEIDVPVSTAYRRVRRLIKNDVIKILARTNPILLGYNHWVRAGIRIRPGFHQDVVIHLSEYPSVYTVSECAGAFNMLIGARFRRMDELTHFVNVELPGLNGIQSWEVFLLVWPRKYWQFYWPENGPDKSLDTCSSAPYELDEIDRGILNVLTEEGTTRPARLGSELGVEEAKIRRHLKRMSDAGVFALGAKVNAAQEYEFSATIGVTVNQRSAVAVLDDIILDDRYITAASLCIGRFNIMLSTRFRRYHLLNEFINVKLPSITGVGCVEAFLHTKRLKYFVSQY